MEVKKQADFILINTMSPKDGRGMAAREAESSRFKEGQDQRQQPSTIYSSNTSGRKKKLETKTKKNKT